MQLREVYVGQKGLITLLHVYLVVFYRLTFLLNVGAVDHKLLGDAVWLDNDVLDVHVPLGDD